MAFGCLILDFDGTFTDVDQEAAPFIALYRQELERLVGADLSAEWTAHEAELRLHPDRHGWKVGGRIVAPANADPYIRCTAIAQRVFDARGLHLEPTARTLVIDALYQASYAVTRTVFRPDARRTLEGVVASGVPAFVVSNSRTDKVSEKLAALWPEALQHVAVFGNAEKYQVSEAVPTDPRFEALPLECFVEGLSARPLYLRRGKYFEVLRAIWEKTGATPSSTLVCGDLYELDLAMPALLGAHVQLVMREDTPEYERNALAALGDRARAGPALSELLQRL